MSDEELGKIKDINDLVGIDGEVAHPDIHFCSFKVGSIKLTIPIESVLEITDLSSPLPLPGSPDHLRGLIPLRGNVIPIIDMSIIHDTKYDKEIEKKLIIIEINNESLALISDGMPELLEKAEGQVMNMNEFFERYKIR